MASITAQRDLVVSLKRETLLNVGILSKLHPMSSDLSRLLKENNLEKPTQNLFNHLAHYMVSIIDPQVTLPWPLYDTKTERTYRNELSVFITDYSNKGLLAPVMSSYLVNPGCYKVIFLMFQMSQLAVQRMLMTKMKKDSQKKLYNEMTERYKTQKEEGFIESIEKETDIMLSKFSNYLAKREAIEEIAKLMRDHIIKMENKSTSCKAQQYIDNLVDRFIESNNFDEETKKEILEIKNVQKPAKYFDNWLAKVDEQITQMESDWETKMGPFLNICQTTLKNTETLIARQTGEADKRTFMIEYNPKTDNLCTDELEKQVNTQQKYILKNIVKDDKLYFPNLIRGFLISICFILKNAEIGDEIYQFNKFLEKGRGNYTEVVKAMRVLVERVMDAQGKLQHPQETFNSTISTRDISEIPPLPDLSDLKMNRDFHPQILFDSFTPLNYSKHQFNLRKQKTGSFMKPLPKVFATPFHVPKEDFFKSLISCRVSAYDNMNITQNTNFNISVVSHVRSNETIAECTSGFTKQQISRLLSTKKSSSSKKFKHKIERPNIKIKKGGLFNESNLSNENVGIFRSHSSPNLYENREKQPRNSLRSRKLSIMKESPSLLEVSGIAALERDSNHSTPQGMLESSRKLETLSIPSITVTPRSDVSDNIDDLNKEIEFKAPTMMLPLRKSKLPQPVSKKSIENQQMLPQRIYGGIVEEEIVLPTRKNANTFENQTVLTQRKSCETFEEQTVFSQRNSYESCEEKISRKSTESIKDEGKLETPKTNPQIVKKTSSLEKIINRFKKVRASMLPSEPREDSNDFKTIFEEKENHNSVNIEDVFTANRNLLPDLLSPSCSIITPKSNNDILDQLYYESDDEKPKNSRKPRESLGTALGVDHTFLDQFDLID